MNQTGIHYLDAQGPPGVRLYAIGDVHGRLDLLEKMHDAIQAEIDRDRVADWRIIHLGDYIDRGPDSRGVIDFLLRHKLKDSRHVSLAGNHDIGLLEFIERPDPHGLFVRFGGVQTAASYDVRLDINDYASLMRSHAALLRAIPAAHLRFLESLDHSAIFGDFFFCHAGIRPGVPLDAQSLDDLIWIRDEFLDHPGLHPKVIVHGHTPQDEPEVMANRVNVDTRAYHSGRLTALVIDGAAKRFLSVKG